MATVGYANERGEDKTFKLTSFSNPQVFATISKAQSGEQYDISTGKNDKDFVVWTSAQLATNKPTATPASAPNAYKSNYASEEERAIQQRLIVRQSSLSNALKFVEVRGTEGLEWSTDEILATADIFAAWVFNKPGLMEMENDIPF